ncbi:MAG TPA: MBL fold metallo-hydrolase [Pseudonocardia sp.]|jgi:cyclase|uniref:MBL fold metallo-hydrolase n=1 Tax=Pseudonocardia sp. TaxID=60912 RepID=UPI002ED8A99B
MSSSPVEAPAHLGEPSVVEVSDGVYAYIQPDGSWWINNTGFLAGSQGVISIDACSTEARTKAYLSAITSVSKRPVRTLINTHHHGDHTFGNCLFEGATIVAHEKTRAEMTAFGPPQPLPFWTPIDWGDLRLELPFLTYAEGVTVWSDELRCEVRYVGTAAHTTNDSIIWLPERSVLFAGDLLFRGGTPFLLMGSVAGAIDVLETVVKPLGAETIVPGHGGISGPELIDDVLGYLRFVQDTARAGKAAGLTPLQAAREVDLGGYAALLDSERIVGNLHRAYAELDGTPRGGQIDVLSALSEMVAYNGGKPLTCYA